MRSINVRYLLTYLLIYIYSGRFTHMSGHPSAVVRAQDSESSPVKDQRSTAALRNQPTKNRCNNIGVSFDLQEYCLNFDEICRNTSTR